MDGNPQDFEAKEFDFSNMGDIKTDAFVKFAERISPYLTLAKIENGAQAHISFGKRADEDAAKVAAHILRHIPHFESWMPEGQPIVDTNPGVDNSAFEVSMEAIYGLHLALKTDPRELDEYTDGLKHIIDTDLLFSGDDAMRNEVLDEWPNSHPALEKRRALRDLGMKESDLETFYNVLRAANPRFNMPMTPEERDLEIVGIAQRWKTADPYVFKKVVTEGILVEGRDFRQIADIYSNPLNRASKILTNKYPYKVGNEEAIEAQMKDLELGYQHLDSVRQAILCAQSGDNYVFDASPESLLKSLARFEAADKPLFNEVMDKIVTVTERSSSSDLGQVQCGDKFEKDILDIVHDYNHALIQIAKLGQDDHQYEPLPILRLEGDKVVDQDGVERGGIPSTTTTASTASKVIDVDALACRTFPNETYGVTAEVAEELAPKKSWAGKLRAAFTAAGRAFMAELGFAKRKEETVMESGPSKPVNRRITEDGTLAFSRVDESEVPVNPILKDTNIHSMEDRKARFTVVASRKCPLADFETVRKPTGAQQWDMYTRNMRGLSKGTSTSQSGSRGLPTRAAAAPAL